jgi:hypothetical protein
MRDLLASSLLLDWTEEPHSHSSRVGSSSRRQLREKTSNARDAFNKLDLCLDG